LSVLANRSRAVKVIVWPAVACSALCVVGCNSRQARVPAPGWDPPLIAARALEQLDADSDITIDPTEAEAVPGIAAAFVRLDADSDGRLSESELQARFAFYEKLRTGLVAQSFRILLNGRPVADAKVDFVPEEFQGGVTEVASGLTDYSGFVVPQTVGQEKPAMQIGFYRVLLYPAAASADKPLETRSPVGVEVSPVNESYEPGGPTLRFETSSYKSPDRRAAFHNSVDFTIFNKGV